MSIRRCGSPCCWIAQDCVHPEPYGCTYDVIEGGDRACHEGLPRCGKTADQAREDRQEARRIERELKKRLKPVVWKTIDSVPTSKTVLLYRSSDLYPVVGHSVGHSVGDEWHYILEEGGCEAGEHRKYPFLKYQPTHWAELPWVPFDA